MTTGFQRFGASLFGQDTSEIEREVVRDVASMESALARARKERDEYQATQEMRQVLEDNGASPEEASVVSTLMRAGKNPEQYSGYRLDEQKREINMEAAEAARSGDLDMMNVLLAVQRGQPMERNKIDSNTIYDPYLEDARPRTTEVGEAQIRNYDERTAPRAAAAPKATVDPINKMLADEIIERYSRMMEMEDADIPNLTARRDKELAALGLGPLIAPGTPASITDVIAGLNGGTIVDDTPAGDTPEGPVEQRKTVRGKMYVKIAGNWYEE